MMNILRLYNTIRHLKPVQIYGRGLALLKRRLLSAGSDKLISRQAFELRQQVPINENAQITFNLLNCERTFPINEIKWQTSDYSEQPEKLWIYHLNYFNWLFTKPAETFSDLHLHAILNWIEKNADVSAEPWEPYPLSLRIISWMKWCQMHPSLPECFAECIKKSIINQCLRLECDLEFHNQGNHLLANLQALFCVSAWLFVDQNRQDAQLDSRLLSCADNLIRQITEQFFADGGHYERSPMYHAEMLEAVCEVRKACSQLENNRKLSSGTIEKIKSLTTLCLDKVPLLQDWLTVMTHPDGRIAQFNDSVLMPGISRETSEAPVNYLLEDSGFFVRRTPDHYFVLSCGEPSPAFQPGHTHCDILSYELSLGTQRCIIDTGIGSYQDESIRNDCRSSQAHNLPFIEHTNQSDIWGSFRIGRRAKILHRRFEAETGLLELEFIDQYEQRFRREIIFQGNSIRVRDRMFDRRVTGTFCSLIHLAPEVLVDPAAETGCSKFQAGEYEFAIHSGARLRIDRYVWYPDFGRPVNAEKLIFSNHEAEAIDYVITWQKA